MAAMQSKPPVGLYFEDFEVGEEITTSGRTITETDILQFAGISGDFNPIHVDAEYSRNSAVGQRVAHGLLIASIASGLAVQTGFLQDTVIYFREIAGWKFIKPVFIGDTIHVRIIVSELQAFPKLGGGLVTLILEVINQSRDIVNRGRFLVLAASRTKK
jgi:3-hydroxybutyryl-CoA dehydratase